MRPAIPILFCAASISCLAAPLPRSSGVAGTLPESFNGLALAPTLPMKNTLFPREANKSMEEYFNWLHNLSNEDLGKRLSSADGDLKNHEHLYGELWRRFSDIIKKAQEDGLDEEQMMKKIFGEDYTFRPNDE